MKLSNVSENELMLIRTYLYEQTGLAFIGSQWHFFKKRIIKRIEESKFSSIREYISFLKFDPRGKQELKDLFNLLTVNETYFFREKPQLEALVNVVLPEMIEEKQKQPMSNMKSIKIWSAASSNGSEPYSIAILLKERGLLKKGVNFIITGTDINTDVINIAREGLFSEPDLRNTPPDIKSKYFTKKGNFYEINEEIKKMVNFSVVNLFSKTQTSTLKNIDIIFCRNVLIYFDLESKKIVAKNLYDSLIPNGYLFLGMSDTLFKVTNLFLLKPLKGVMVYRKPGGGK